MANSLSLSFAFRHFRIIVSVAELCFALCRYFFRGLILGRASDTGDGLTRLLLLCRFGISSFRFSHPLQALPAEFAPSLRLILLLLRLCHPSIMRPAKSSASSSFWHFPAVAASLQTVHLQLCSSIHFARGTNSGSNLHLGIPLNVTKDYQQLVAA